MEKRKLTEKQERFIDYYIELGNATEAARKAGYSERSAKQIGNENLTKLDFFIKERLKELEDKRTADVKEVLQYLTSVMRGEEVEEVVGFTDKGVQRVRKLPNVKDRVKAAELLGKRYSLFTDKLDVEGTIDTGTEKLDSILEQLKED